MVYIFNHSMQGLYGCRWRVGMAYSGSLMKPS